DNIKKWRSEIQELEEKIHKEEAKKEHYVALAVEVPRAKIEELAHEGIQHYSDRLAVQKEVELLASEKEVLQRKLVHIQEQYQRFRTTNKAQDSPFSSWHYK
ncbi:hypothetical protein L195_g052812, partial [Trifolium pratense]